MARMLTIVMIIALLARVFVVVWSWSDWHVLPPDTLVRIYQKQGDALATTGKYMAMRPPDPTQPGILHPPGMALLIAGFRSATGEPSDIPLQLLGTLFDTLAAGILTWLVSTTIGQRAGFGAGIAYALWPPSVWAAAGSRTPEGLMPLFVLGALVCAVNVGRTTGNRSWLWAAAGGGLVGLASYLRSDYLLMPIALSIPLAFSSRRPAKAFASMAFAQALVFVMLLPWAWRNHGLYERWIFTSTSVGATLVSGLGEFSNPWNFGYTDEDRAREARAQGIESPWYSKADIYFRSVFLRAVQDHPGAYVLSILKRIPLGLAAPQSFGFANPLKTQTFSEARAASGKDRFSIIRENPRYILLAYWDVLLIAFLNIIGFVGYCVMFVRERGKRAMVVLLVMPHLYALASHVLTHMEPRYLLPSAFVVSMGVGWVVNQSLGRPMVPALPRCDGQRRSTYG